MTRDLPRFIKDTEWSVLPGIEASAGKPPAIILDIDETVVTNFDFQVNHLPYTSYKHFVWNRDNRAVPVPGAVDFIKAAQDAGVTVFFVTNRACERFAGIDGDCPQKAVSLQDLREAGFDTNNDRLMLANEQPGWGKEKSSRRHLIAQSYRVIMLFGDDLGDFIFCSREKPVAPCNSAATRTSRADAVDQHHQYWGEGWYILPNPMHGSWTNFL